MTSDLVVRANPRLAWVRTGDRITMLDLDHPAGEPLFLVGTACVIWDLLQEGPDLSAVSLRLSTDFGVPLEDVLEDVSTFVAKALDMAILVAA